MPLYYFNVYDDDVTLDPEGVELADDNAAHAYAIKETRILASETVRNGHLVMSHRVEYTDAEQSRLGEVRFDEAVEIRP